MAERRVGFRLGVFVAGSFIALTGLAILFGGTPHLFVNRVKYTLLFPEAPGIAPGTPVRKSGVRIGEVQSLDLDEASGQVRVTIQVDKKFLPRQAEEPAISRGILSGDSSIDFIPKLKPDPELVTVAYPPDSDIPGVAPINTRQLLNQASGALPNAQATLEQIMTSFRRLEQVAPKMERALEEFQLLARSGREALPELRKTNVKIQELLGADQPNEPATLKALIQEIRDLVKVVRPVADDLRAVISDNKTDFNQAVRSIRTISERINDLLNDDNRKSFSATLKNVESGSGDLAKLIRLAGNVTERAETTMKLLNDRLTQAERLFENIDKATQPIAANAGDILKNLNAASLQLAQTLVEIREVTRQFGRAEGTVGQLLKDPALYQNLNEAAASLTRTLIRAERVAKDLEVFADKVARRPETIGIGGALRPSTGLKGSPNAPSNGPVFPSIPIGGPNLAPTPPMLNPTAPIPSLPPGAIAPAPLPPVGSQYRPPSVALPPPIYPQND
jgi:phospholipid/cholesterol/gamma-HCH transport system substrate-binding protein